MPQKINYELKNFGQYTKRRDYSKTRFSLPLTDVLAIQKESFDWFLNKAIEATLRKYYPIKSSNNKVEIKYVLGSKRIEKPLVTEQKAVKEAKQKGISYSARLYVKLQKHITETGEISFDEVILCDIPLMTSSGSFIINGFEKVIVSQLIRSPGAYFAQKTRDKQSDDLFNKVEVLPRIGSWIEIKHKVTSNLDSVKIKIDKHKSFLLTTFLSSFGFTEESMYKLFGNSETLKNTLSKDKILGKNKDIVEIIKEAQENIFRIVRRGDRITKEASQNLISNLLFNEKRYNLSKTGRYMLNRKLSLFDRIITTYLAQDIVLKNVDPTMEAKILYPKGTYITNDIAIEIQNAFKEGLIKNIDLKDYGITSDVYGKLLDTNPKLKNRMNIIGIYIFKSKKAMEKDGEKHFVIGNDPTSVENHLLISDIVAIINYYFNLNENIGRDDDPDSLINKRIVSVGELLLNQLNIGLLKMEKNTREKMSSKEISRITPKNITNNKMIQNQIKTFFNSSKLSQFMDQTNPLSEISTKRKITSLGPGGLNRDTAQFEVRDVHATHYGRICPIETPEGPNIGLILNLATYAKVDEYGFLQTPYFKVTNGIVDFSQPVYLTAHEEINRTFAQSSISIDENGKITDEQVIVKSNFDYNVVSSKEVDYIDVSSKQMTSLAASSIPFLENNDANRALMGSNMQRQAVPLLFAEAPLVATGIEADIAKFSPNNLKSTVDGEVVFVDGSQIKIKDSASEKGSIKTYQLKTFEKTNQGTVISQSPIVKMGDKVLKGDLISDSSSFKDGEMALGKNVLVGFSTWNGYNYEDAIIVSERLVKDDVFTSIHIEEQTIQFRKSKAGDDKLTADIPNASLKSRRHLDENGIVRIGSEVVTGDILVGRVSPKGDENISPAEKLLNGIFNQKISNEKDTSLKVKNGHQGTVIDVEILSRENGNVLEEEIDMMIKVYVAQKRKIKVGDKMAGRHGNKGVISRVLPVEDMPYLEDGTPLDIILNPQGVPSRMNIGQVLELHLGMAAKKLGVKFVSPVFDGVKKADIMDALEEAKLPRTGKMKVFDPTTGEKIDNEISVGVMYMFKLSHMVDDKMHSRSIGPYSLITQQPLGGKSQNGGQRFGEMETWALESYGAANILQEILTYKSDDIQGRNNLYSALTSGTKLPKPGVPESFSVLAYELRGLGIKLQIHEKEEEKQELPSQEYESLNLDQELKTASENVSESEF